MRLRGFLLTAVLACAALAGSGCVDQAYVAADRQTKTAVEPFMREHAAEHPDQAARIGDVLDSWEARVQRAEQQGQQNPLAPQGH